MSLHAKDYTLNMLQHVWPPAPQPNRYSAQWFGILWLLSSTLVCEGWHSKPALRIWCHSRHTLGLSEQEQAQWEWSLSPRSVLSFP